MSTSSVWCPRRPSPSSPGTGPFAAGIMVSASHNPALDNGLKVLDGHGLKLDDSIEDELEQLIWRTEELPGAPNDELGRMIDATRSAGRLPGASPRARRDRSSRAVSVSSSMPRTARAPLVGPEILAATGAHGRGHPRRARRQQHQRPVGGDRARVARRGGRRGRRRRGLRARRRRRPADRRGRRRAGRGRRPGPRASSRSTGWAATRCPAAASSCRSCRTAVCRPPWRRPAGRSSGPRSATSTSSRGCRSPGAVLGGEKSGHVIVLEHTTSGDGIVTALEVLRVMAGRSAWPRRAGRAPSRCCRSNSGR